MSGTPKQRVVVSEQQVEFGKFVRRTRESQGLEIGKAAERGGMSRGTLAEYEKGFGRSEPAVRVYEQIARALNLELSFVLHKAGFDMGAGGVNMARLERVERTLQILDERAPEVRRAIAEAMLELERVPARGAVPDERIITAGNRLGRALGAVDLITERLREDR